MSFWGNVWREVKTIAGQAAVGLATASSAAGAAAGATSTAPGAPTPWQSAVEQTAKGPAVAPGEAIKQSAQAVVGAGPLAPSFRTPVVWVIIIAVALIGVWGLIAPGGGVALIQRKIVKG